MAYPDRTYATVRHAGAASDSRMLDSPVNGGADGEDTPDIQKFLEAFVATEQQGVGVVKDTA